MKTAELSGIRLDWAVAAAAGVPNIRVFLPRRPSITDGWIQESSRGFSPTKDWSQAGPLIEKHQIDLYCYQSNPPSWVAEITGTKAKGRGTRPLVAAMRCLVASVFGDETELPEELVCD